MDTAAVIRIRIAWDMIADFNTDILIAVQASASIMNTMMFSATESVPILM